MITLNKLFVSATLCALTLGCGTENEARVSSANPDSDLGLSLPNPAAVVANNNTSFALDLMQESLKSGEPNQMLSPYSISSALGMTYAGAEGITAKEMQKTLKFSMDKSVTNLGFGMLNRSLKADMELDGYQLSIANRLWGEKTFQDRFKDEFLNITEKEYGAAMQAVDFKNNPETSRIEINEWVEENTNDRIQDLIPDGAIKSNMRLVLTNAVYFNGEWETKFDEKMTRDEDFYVSDEKTVNVPMMKRLSFYKTFVDPKLDAQVLELPYASKSEDKKTSMVIILPNQKNGLKAVQTKLDQERLAYIQNRLPSVVRARVSLTLPKWKTETSLDLAKTLKGLGMSTAFDEVKANFRGIAKLSPNETLYISKVLHKTFIQVGEGGTEAAGATAVLMPIRTTSVQPPMSIKFIADHPFVYFIRDQATGSILFMGQLNNPQ